MYTNLSQIAYLEKQRRNLSIDGMLKAYLNLVDIYFEKISLSPYI